MKLPIVVAFLSGVCVTVVVLALLKFPVWKRSKDQGSLGASADSAPLELGREANSSIDARKNQSPEAGTIVWPASPKDAVADAVSSLSGKALESKLYEAGIYYASLGIEEAKEFCLALPPGAIGGRVIRWVVRKADGYEPEMMAFLKKEEEHLSPDWVRASTWSLVSSWKNSNTTEVLDYLTNAEILNQEEKRRLIDSILYRPPDDWGTYEDVTRFVEGMGDLQLKKSVMHSHGYIDARFRTLDPSEALKGVSWSDTEDLTALSNILTDVIRELDDPGPALRAMESSSYPQNTEVLISTYKNWIREDINSALTAVSAMNDSSTRDEILSSALPTIRKSDPAAAERWEVMIRDRR